MVFVLLDCVVCARGKRFKSNKKILLTVPYFEPCFNPSAQTEIELDFDENVVEMFLKNLVSGKTLLTKENFSLEYVSLLLFLDLKKEVLDGLKRIEIES